MNRDAGLHKVGAVTRWVAAGALAGTGFFAGLASYSSHLAAATKSRTNTSGAVSARQSSDSASANSAANGDNNSQVSPVTPATAPTVLPAQSGNFAPIVSGAS